MTFKHESSFALTNNQFSKILPKEDIYEMKKTIIQKVLPQNTIIFKQGDVGDYFYIINYGKVKIYRRNQYDIVYELAILGPGESFGELSLLTGEPRFGYAVAIEETEVVLVEKIIFEQMIKEHPYIVSTMIKKVSKWLYSINKELDSESERQYMETQALMNKLDKLYIASSWLHSSLDFNSVIEDITDIVTNLTGAKGIAVFMISELGDKFVPIKIRHVEVSSVDKIKIDRNNIIGISAIEGELYFRNSFANECSYIDITNPLVCIPLKIKEHVIGLIAVYSFYVKKDSFTQKDIDNFNLLTHHAAIALFTSRAYTVEKKTKNVSKFDYLLILVISLIFSIIFNMFNPNGIKLLPASLITENISVIDVIKAKDKYLKGNVIFIDAMPKNFYEHEHIEGAINLSPSLFDIMYEMDLREVDKNTEIIVYGRTISRHYDKEVALRLILLGHKNTSILEGGISRWKTFNLPVKSLKDKNL